MDKVALAALVRSIHASILAFVLLAPIVTQSVTVAIAHAAVLLALLTHWATSQHYCVLSLLECKLRSIPYEDGFLNSVLKPLFGYGVSNRLAYAVTLALLAVSLVRIYGALAPRAQCDPLRDPRRIVHR
jgi:hypothetical protein